MELEIFKSCPQIIIDAFNKIYAPINPFAFKDFDFDAWQAEEEQTGCNGGDVFSKSPDDITDGDLHFN